MKLADLMLQVDTSDWRQWLIPLEHARSWPIPMQRDGRLFLAFFHFRIDGSPDQPAVLLRPDFASVVDLEDARLVEFRDASFSDFAAGVQSGSEIATLPAAGPTGNSFEEIGQLREELSQAYDAIIEIAFWPPGDLVAEQLQAVSDFGRKFAGAVDVALRDFYVALNPDFFNWLQEVSKRI